MRGKGMNGKTGRKSRLNRTILERTDPSELAEIWTWDELGVLSKGLLLLGRVKEVGKSLGKNRKGKKRKWGSPLDCKRVL